MEQKGSGEHGAQPSQQAAAVSAGPRAQAGARLPALPGPNGTCLSACHSPRPSSCSRVPMPKGYRKPGTHHPLNTCRLPSRSHRGKAHVLFCFANSAFIYRANLFSRFHSSKCVTTCWTQSPAWALRQLALRSRAPALGPGVSAVPQTGTGMPSHTGRATQTCLLVPRADTHTHTRGVGGSQESDTDLLPRAEGRHRHATQDTAHVRMRQHDLFKEKVAKDGRHI